MCSFILKSMLEVLGLSAFSGDCIFKVVLLVRFFKFEFEFDVSVNNIVLLYWDILSFGLCKSF